MSLVHLYEDGTLFTIVHSQVKQTGAGPAVSFLTMFRRSSAVLYLLIPCQSFHIFLVCFRQAYIHSHFGLAIASFSASVTYITGVTCHLNHHQHQYCFTSQILPYKVTIVLLPGEFFLMWLFFQINHFLYSLCGASSLLQSLSDRREQNCSQAIVQYTENIIIHLGSYCWGVYNCSKPDHFLCYLYNIVLDLICFSTESIYYSKGCVAHVLCNTLSFT